MPTPRSHSRVPLAGIFSRLKADATQQEPGASFGELRIQTQRMRQERTKASPPPPLRWLCCLLFGSSVLFADGDASQSDVLFAASGAVSSRSI